MNWLKELKVSTKLIFGFSIMLVFMVVIGLAGYRSITNINNNLEDIFAVRLPSIDNLIEADRDLQQLLVAERSMIFTNVKSDLFNELVSEYETNLKQSDDRFNRYRALATTPEEKAVICSSVRELREGLSSALPAIRRLITSGKIRMEDFSHTRYNGCEIIP